MQRRVELGSRSADSSAAIVQRGRLALGPPRGGGAAVALRGKRVGRVAGPAVHTYNRPAAALKAACFVSATERSLISPADANSS
jgi:hypothetical protein